MKKYKIVKTKLTEKYEISLIHEASNEYSKEIETIEARNKPTWLPPQPFLDIGIKSRLIYERFRAKNEI